MKLTLTEKESRRCAISISWFWFLGATYLTQFPNLAVQALHVDETVVTLFLVMFTLGVATGSLLCDRLLRGKISLQLAPAAALALALFGFDFCLAAQTYAAALSPAPLAPENFSAFVARGVTAFRLLADLFLLSVAGGIFYVPLYARVQKLIPLAQRARVMAGIGFLNAVFMTLSSLLGLGILAGGFSGLTVIFVSVFMTLGIAFYSRTPPEHT